MFENTLMKFDADVTYIPVLILQLYTYLSPFIKNPAIYGDQTFDTRRLILTQ